MPRHPGWRLPEFLARLARPTDPRLVTERLRALMPRLPWTLLGGLMLALLAVAVTWRSAGGRGLTLWMTAFLALSAVRLALVAGYQADRGRDGHPRLWSLSVFASTLAGGLMWLAFGFLAIRPADTTETLLVTGVLCCLVFSSHAILQPFRPAYLAFALPCMAGWIGPCLLSGDKTLILLAAAGIAGTFFLLFHVRSARPLDEALALRAENRRLAEELEREKSRAELSSMAKSRFLAYVSHDLRQPLHAQELFLSVLAGSVLPGDTRVLVEKIRTCSHALAEMLDALLDITRIESGGLTPAPKPVALIPLLETLEQEFVPQAEAHGLRLTVMPTKAVVWTDPLMLERILRNLLSNALRYTEKGGIVIGCRRRGEYALLQVVDTGIGIPESQTRTIFREFHQLGQYSRDGHKGLGLGLAIVEGLARALRTQVTVRSRLGRGSVFSLTLPLTQQLPARERKLRTQAPGSLQGTRVLVVEDDPTSCEAMASLLVDWGCQPILTASAVQALRVVEDLEAAPDIIIADYHLSERQAGTAVIAALRERCGAQIPALIVTGDTLPKAMRELLDAGLPVLHKPLKPARLRLALITLLRTAHLAPPAFRKHA